MDCHLGFGGFSSLGICPLSTPRLLALSCTPKPKYQLVEEQGAFLGSPFI